MPAVRHRAVAQAALAATGARTAVTEDDAIHCIASHTLTHRVCLSNGYSSAAIAEGESRDSP
mgnify:FL=1